MENFTRYHSFNRAFLGYKFFNKHTMETIPKFEIFATYFQTVYPNDGVCKFVSPEANQRFDLIVKTLNGQVIRMHQHPYIDLRDSNGWKNGVIENPLTFFTKSNPTQDVISEQNKEGIV